MLLKIRDAAFGDKVGRITMRAARRYYIDACFFYAPYVFIP